MATPTGSTAYALSGGGPIMHPRLDALVLVPMFPHALSSRPIVIDGNSELKIVIGRNNPTYPQLSCDGQVHVTAAPGDTVTVHKKPYKLRLIHPSAITTTMCAVPSSGGVTVWITEYCALAVFVCFFVLTR